MSGTITTLSVEDDAIVVIPRDSLAPNCTVDIGKRAIVIFLDREPSPAEAAQILESIKRPENQT